MPLGDDDCENGFSNVVGFGVATGGGAMIVAKFSPSIAGLFGVDVAACLSETEAAELVLVPMDV